jgi:hypothetical protein
MLKGSKYLRDWMALNEGSIQGLNERGTYKMKIRFLGHAAVEIVSDSGLRILTDPFTPG